jgi:hypothetical protein
MKSFSKFKKQIDNLFVSELKMEFCCYSYPMRSQRGSTSIPRFCVKIGKEIIWDCPKDFKIKGEDIYMWSNYNGICDLVREYIDTPVDKLLSMKFKNDVWKCINNYHLENMIERIEIKYRLTEIFKAADRRLGKSKLIDFAKKVNNPVVDLIIKKRFK